MANKKLSELPYINSGKISGNTLVPLVTYFSATTGDTVHTFVEDLQTYLISGLTGNTDVFVTGGTYSAGTITFVNNSGGTFTVTGVYTGETSYVNSLNTGVGLSANTTTGDITIINTDPDQTVVLNNGTNINVTGTYPNFTIDVTGLTDFNTFTTGFTYSSNTFTIKDNSGSTFNATFTDVTGLTVNGNLNITGTTYSNVVSATTYQNLPDNVTGNYLPISGGTVTGNTIFQSGLTATTISATTYQNLPTDIRVTGGTYSAGTITFTNNTGGTFNVSGITSTTGPFGISDSGGTYTYYSNLSSAMSAATSGQTIELFADVTETGAVTITLKNGVNINGNGHTYTLDTSTTATGFIDGGVAVVMNFTNITLVRKGAGAGIMIGLSVSGNRIVGNSTLIKIESNSSTGIANYGGAVFSGYIIGFAVICTGTSCAGISLIRANIDNCTAISTGTGISLNIGFLTNSSGESTGSGNGLQITNTGQMYNCHGRSNTGYGILASSPVYNSNGYSAGSYGIRFENNPLYNCVGISAANYGIWGYSDIISNCTSLSTAGGALFIQNAQANNCMMYSTVSSAVVMFNSSTVHNSTLRTLSGALTVNTANLTTYGSLKNCTIINDWNSALGHGVSANSVLTVINCTIKVINSSANCLNASSAVTMKYTNNAFEGASTPVNVNITQGIINTQDNQGNILI